MPSSRCLRPHLVFCRTAEGSMVVLVAERRPSLTVPNHGTPNHSTAHQTKPNNTILDSSQLTLRESVKKGWKLITAFAIKRRTLPAPPPPFNFHPFFCTWILFIWNGFYIWSQSKLSFLSPFIIGSKLTFSRWSDRCLPYSALFRVNSTSIYT